MRRKIERCSRRNRSRSDSPTVLLLGVGEVLSRLNPNESSPRAECHPSEPQEIVQSSEDELISEKDLEDLRKASKFCQDLLRILKKLDQLRSARIGQFQGQGRPIPEGISCEFSDKMSFILSQLESTQLVINKLTMRLKDTQSKSANLSMGGTSDFVNGDDIIPNKLPPSVKYALFGSFDVGESTRWNGFYSQCNRNFSDFVRIR
ncbi:unnamed protein product [Rodentolepis nana]|uniref:Syntaxin-5_N domain-containing protein n=1 Tax=Rodentolepis nana TaxID=102285 RepID=A0A0R3T2B5_RODNA|nr:unnamed protein product [Rodentolepis nana]